jgi:hypothetical protein
MQLVSSKFWAATPPNFAESGPAGLLTPLGPGLSIAQSGKDRDKEPRTAKNEREEERSEAGCLADMMRIKAGSKRGRRRRRERTGDPRSEAKAHKRGCSVSSHRPRRRRRPSSVSRWYQRNSTPLGCFPYSLATAPIPNRGRGRRSDEEE